MPWRGARAMRVFTTVIGQKTTAANDRDTAPSVNVRSVDSPGLFMRESLNCFFKREST